VKPVGRGQLIAVALIAVGLFVGYQVQKHREGTPTPRRSAEVVFSATSPETRLAALQLAERPDHANSTVKRFAALLDILAADCPADSRHGLADLTVRTVMELRHGGIPATPTEVMGGVVGAPDIGGTERCAGFFRRYVALRRQEGD
jgi:hypothetical protein